MTENERRWKKGEERRKSREGKQNVTDERRKSEDKMEDGRQDVRKKTEGERRKMG